MGLSFSCCNYLFLCLYLKKEENNMNKQELVAALAAKLSVSLKEAGEAIDGVFGILTETLEKGETVKVAGFGIFSVKERAARDGTIPGTTQKIKIPAKKVIGFKAAKGLKESL
jgi:DNA-binding protein HU-beta